MPHNRLQLQGGVIENETPVINQAGVASSNRIRFRPDNQGLSLVEKIGGWAKFYASTITAGVVRALWGWQDTNGNQWIAFAADSSTASELGVIQCTVSGSTGLTTATGTLKNITPDSQSSQSSLNFQTGAGNATIIYVDSTMVGVSTPPLFGTLYITTPVAVGGLVLSGQYVLTNLPTGASLIGDGTFQSIDLLGNPLPAVYTTTPNSITINSVTIVPTVSLTVNFTGPAAQSPP